MESDLFLSEYTKKKDDTINNQVYYIKHNLSESFKPVDPKNPNTDRDDYIDRMLKLNKRNLSHQNYSKYNYDYT